MRRWLLDLHLHLGLFCLPYVVVLGVSGLLLVHAAPRASKSEWHAQLAPLAEAAPEARAAAVLAALGLRAGVLGQSVRRDAEGGLSFRAIRPGRTYQVALAASGDARVVALDFGVLGVVRDLHGRSETQGSLWELGWALYTELTVGVLLFSIASGSWLALTRASDRTRSAVAALLGTAAVAALAAVLW